MSEKSKQSIESACMHVFGAGMMIGFQEAGFSVKTDMETFGLFKDTVTRNRPNIDYRHSAEAEFDYDNLKGIPLLFGNPRCSGFSCINAGVKGKHGHDAEQTIDLRQFWKATRDLQPTLSIYESVQQCGTTGRPLLQAMYDDLKNYGYRFAEVYFDNRDIGVPQNRKRFFGVAYKADQINFNIELYQPQIVTVAEAIKDLMNVNCRTFLNNNMNACVCDDHVDGKLKDGTPVYNHVCYPLAEENRLALPFLKTGESLYDLSDADLGNSPKLLAKRQAGKGFSWAPVQRLRWDVARVIYSRSFVFCHPELDRTLSVREAARLMSFPDDWVFYGTHPFIHVGNGVSIRTSKWIAGECKKALEGYWGGEDYEIVWHSGKKQLIKRAPVDPLVKRFELNQISKVKETVDTRAS